MESLPEDARALLQDKDTLVNALQVNEGGHLPYIVPTLAVLYSGNIGWGQCPVTVTVPSDCDMCAPAGLTSQM